MRRTYISIALLANNFDVKWVVGQVGHADSKMTLDAYAQLEQRVDRSHGESFDSPNREKIPVGEIKKSKSAACSEFRGTTRPLEQSHYIGDWAIGDTPFLTHLR